MPGLCRALIALTVITTAVAYVDLGAFSVVVALAIAVCKMLLVALFFMHLRHSTTLDEAGGGGRTAVAGHPAGADPERFPHPRLAAGSGQISRLPLRYDRKSRPRARSSAG